MKEVWWLRVLRRSHTRLIARIETRLALLAPNHRPTVQQVISENLACLWANALVLLLPGKAITRTEIQDPEGFESLAKSSSGVIWLGLHQGVFEVLPQILGQHQAEVYCPHHAGARAQRIWAKMRRRKHVQSVAYPKIRSLYKKWLKKPTHLVTLGDQGPLSQGALVLGQRQSLSISLVRHLRAKGYQVVLFRVTRTPQGYSLTWKQIEPVESLTLSYASFWEESLKLAPKQWIWHYPRHWPDLPQFLRQSSANSFDSN